MYVIIGVSYVGYGPSDEIWVATFSSEKAAELYLKKSKTAKGFSKKSLLRGYDDAFIEYKEDIDIPHNPKL